MRANTIENLTPQETEAWNEFHGRRTLELKTDFPDANPQDIEKKVWIEFIANKYTLSQPSPFSEKSNIMDSLGTNDFGPDSRCYLKCFYHPSVAIIPEEALVNQNVNILESKLPVDSKEKKPLSLYNFFFKKRNDEIKAKHPMMKIQDISRLIGKEWHTIPRQKVEEEYFIEFGRRPP